MVKDKMTDGGILNSYIETQIWSYRNEIDMYKHATQLTQQGYTFEITTIGNFNIKHLGDCTYKATFTKTYYLDKE